ncbi:MAG: hypothetical protein Q9191_008193 [Dirinaria sp. TL-2023a]
MQVRGKKNLVIEKSLAGPIGLFIKFSTLQEYGVDKVFFLENDNVDSSQKNIIFLARGEKASQAIAVADQIKRLQKNRSNEHEFSVIWVPRRTLVCNKILEEAGVLGDVSVEALSLYFIPLEQDVLSLALEDSFGDLLLRKDPTSIFLAAQGLMQIQQKYGLFPRIIGKGDHARRLMDLLFRMRSEASADEATDVSRSQLGMIPSASIESLIIIDRDVDLSTPLLTQLTYEGLIDELFGIQYNQADINTSIVGPVPGSQQNTTPDAQQSRKRKIQLDSSDKLYAQLRDTNFATGSRLLNKFAKRLQSDYESRHVAKSTSELRDFVNKLPAYQSEQQSLKIQVGLAQDIEKQTLHSDIFSRVLEVQQNLVAGADPSSQHDAIEELISRDAPLLTVLRLLCLESCVSGGLRQKDLDNFKRQILHAYGYQHLLTLSALEKMQLLQSRTGNAFLGTAAATPSAAGTNYAAIRRPLRLILDEVNEQEPDDIAYVYSMYAPLSIRLVQCVLQKPYLSSLAPPPNPSSAAHGWSGFEDVLKNVKGDTFTKAQKADSASSEQAVKARHMLTGHQQGAGNKKKTVMVMFVGGVTYTEIAALRFVAKQEEERRRILICTTDVLNGNQMVGAAVEKGDFGKG